MKKTIATSLVTTLAMTGFLTISAATPANAATCTSKEIATMKKINLEMVFFTVSGDTGKVYAAIDKANAATKSKTMKTLYANLEEAVSQGYVVNGTASKLWLSLQSKLKYNRC